MYSEYNGKALYSRRRIVSILLLNPQLLYIELYHTCIYNNNIIIEESNYE